MPKGPETLLEAVSKQTKIIHDMGGGIPYLFCGRPEHPLEWELQLFMGFGKMFKGDVQTLVSLGGGG